MNEAFNNQMLVERLAKLNSSQQSIETLSSWCVFHRKKAKQIVETWNQVFNSSPKEQKVSFLYLANDILQNSRRKGSEFVNEFWKVLPGCLKNVYENGDDQGKKIVNRLVDIWDERKVFGSRGRGLKDEILGTAPAPVLDNGKSLNPIKVVRKDANSVRIKLAVGGMPEKIVTAYQSVLDEHFIEDTTLNKCKATAEVVWKMEKDVDAAITQGIQQGLPLINNLQEQEAVLKHCVEQLESVKATRATLVAQLKEALKEQEAKLELIENQLQVAKTEIEHASGMKWKLSSATSINGVGPSPILSATNLGPEATVKADPGALPKSVSPQLCPAQLSTSFASTISSGEEEHKKAAAAVAAKLAASSSSAQVLSSILSSLAAEEAATMSNGLNASNSPHFFPVEKRPRLEKSMSISEGGSNTSYFGQMQQQQQQQSIPLVLPQSSASSMQPLSQSNQAPAPFTPPPPPLPPLPPPHVQQYMQTSGVPMGAVPYGFIGNTLPSLAPLPSHLSLGLSRPDNSAPPPPPPPPPQQQQQQQPLQQLQAATMGGVYTSPGIGFYGQLQTSSSVQRQ